MLVIFGLLTLQVLVPRQFAHVCRSVNIEWGFNANRVAVIAFHKTRFSKFQTLKNHWKFREILYVGQLNVIRNSGVLKTGLNQEAWKVWGLKSLSKQYGIRRNQLWKQIMSWELNISTQTRRASSGTIYTWERTSAQRNTSLLPLSRKSDGQGHSVSSSGTLRTSKKTSSRTRNFSPSRSSITKTTRFMLKRPFRCILRVQGCHHPSYIMVWC